MKLLNKLTRGWNYKGQKQIIMYPCDTIHTRKKATAFAWRCQSTHTHTRSLSFRTDSNFPIYTSFVFGASALIIVPTIRSMREQRRDGWQTWRSFLYSKWCNVCISLLYVVQWTVCKHSKLVCFFHSLFHQVANRNTRITSSLHV
jgi:hypothetical protein